MALDQAERAYLECIRKQGGWYEWHCRAVRNRLSAGCDRREAGSLLFFRFAASDLVAIAALGYYVNALLGFWFDQSQGGFFYVPCTGFSRRTQ
jgi:hypothetical protein